MKTKQPAKRFTCKQVMTKLKALGSAQTVKTYRNHGITGEIFGVSYAKLKKLDKEIPFDQELAEALWATGNCDARVMACWKADEDKITAKGLDAWARDIKDHGVIYELAALAAYTDLGAGRSRKWREMKDEMRCALGWRVLATLAMHPDRTEEEGGVTDEELTECLETIEAKIHGMKNAVRRSMNTALISIGCRSTMTKLALAAAKRIGPVHIDHGKTNCKTDVAYDEIKKTVAKYKAKGLKPTDGVAGKRRRHC